MADHIKDKTKIVIQGELGGPASRRKKDSGNGRVEERLSELQKSIDQLLALEGPETISKRFVQLTRNALKESG